MNVGYCLAAIAVGAACTFFLRVLPYLVFRDGRTMPTWLEQLGQQLPAAIMAVLLVYCVRDAGTDWMGIGLPKAIAIALVALSYKWRHNTLLSIAAGTVCYMVLIRVL